MIKAINIFLFLLCIVLGYFLYQGIKNPIKSKNQVEARNNQVHDQLLKIRDSQEAFRDLHDKFAPNFDTLKNVIKSGSFEKINLQTGDVTKVSIVDSLFGGDMNRVNNIEDVPNSDAKFNMEAGFLEDPNDSTLFIPVFEASTYTDKYMDGVNPNFWDAEKKVKVGSMTSPITSGNWE